MKKIDWDHLRVFLAASRAGSLRGASEDLGVNHATIRRAISGLEDSLRTRIFDRSSGGLTLTQPGETLLAHAEAIEHQTTQIQRKLSGLDTVPSGIIRVSMPPSFAQGFLGEILAGFTTEYPDIDVRLIATNKVSDLSKSEADVSIRVAYKVEDDVVGRRLLQYNICVFATPEYLAARPNLTIGDGSDANWIGYGGDNSWVASSPFPNAKVRHILPEVFPQIEAAANGAGMAWVPAFMADRDPRLIRVPGVVAEPNRWIWLLLHGDLRNTARVRAFVDYTADAIVREKARFTC